MTRGSGDEDDWATATEEATARSNRATNDDDRIRFTGDLLGSIRKGLSDKP